MPFTLAINVENALSSSTTLSDKHETEKISMLKCKTFVERGYAIPVLIRLYCIRIEDS